MKKVLTLVLAGILVTGAFSATEAEAADEGRGGPMGFVAGCCFGLRAAMDYNEGKEIHWREWCRLIPYAGIVFAVWDGVEGYQGKTSDYYAIEYGSTYY